MFLPRGKDFISSHLTMNDVLNYWRALLLEYGALCTYEITLRKDGVTEVAVGGTKEL